MVQAGLPHWQCAVWCGCDGVGGACVHRTPTLSSAVQDIVHRVFKVATYLSKHCGAAAKPTAAATDVEAIVRDLGLHTQVKPGTPVATATPVQTCVQLRARGEAGGDVLVAFGIRTSALRGAVPGARLTPVPCACTALLFAVVRCGPSSRPMISQSLIC